MTPEEAIKQVPVEKRELWRKNDLALLWLRTESIHLAKAHPDSYHIVGTQGFLALPVLDLLILISAAREDETPNQCLHRILGGPRLAATLHSEPELADDFDLRQLLRGDK